MLLFRIESIVVSFNSTENNLNEERSDTMKFGSNRHRCTFLKEAKKQSLKNRKLVAALYLLTADEKLWKAAESSVGKDDIVFKNIHLKNGSENAYALYCAAKDLYNGSRQLYIDDIANSDVIKGRVFNLICNAMLIKRVGLTAINSVMICDSGKEEN